MEGLVAHGTSRNVKEQKYIPCTQDILLLHPLGKFDLPKRGIYEHPQRSLNMTLFKQTEINLLLRITLSACIWPEGKICSLKLMHLVNPISDWHIWLATLLGRAWLQVPCIISTLSWVSFKEIDHSGFLVAHKTLKDNKACPFKTSALTKKKDGVCMRCSSEPEPCNLLPLCQQTRVSNPSKPEGKSKSSTAGLAFLSPLCRTGWRVAGHTGKTSSSCQGAGLLCPSGWWQD